MSFDQTNRNILKHYLNQRLLDHFYLIASLGMFAFRERLFKENDELLEVKLVHRIEIS